ncbi:KALRN [Branchiostoma lanceolatum]|uniref:KALRN protein n=1 Tax=Branchiostoma lanceolatum TaxID=7740 RepID=A0A8J9ZAS7_BRALA|nr:KALRN [Branchiostoma lanceolatum]
MEKGGKNWLPDLMRCPNGLCESKKHLNPGQRCDGELLEHLVKVPDLCEADIVQYLAQLLEALQYIHSKDIVHLDIKPENLLLTKSESGQIKLCDFGLSRQLLPDTPETCRFGTPEFVAPETVAKEPVHLTTDIWSTGVLLYVLLSGVSPFMGNNDKETYTRVKAGRWAFDQKIFNHISNEAKDFITKMLVVDPKKRPMASQCLEDVWIKTPVSKETAAKISADRLKFFHSRRKWQKSLISVGAPLKMRPISQVLSSAGGSQSLGIKRGPDDSDSPLSSEAESTDVEGLTSEADTVDTDSDHGPSPIPGRRPLQPKPGTAADKTPKKPEKREIPKLPQLVIRRPSLTDSDDNPLSPPLSPPLQREWDKPKGQERSQKGRERSPKRRPRSPSPRRGRREEKRDEKEEGKTQGERTLRPPHLRKSRSFESDRSRSQDKTKTSPKLIKKSDSTEDLRKKSKEKARPMRRAHSADRYLSSRGIELPGKDGENLVHMLRRMASTEKPSQLETLPEDSAEEGPTPRRVGSEVRSEGATRPAPRVLWTVGSEETKKKEEGGMKIPRSSIISGGMRDLDTSERPRLKRGKSAEERLKVAEGRETEERRRRLRKAGSAEAALTTSSDDDLPRGEVARDDRRSGARRPGKLRRAISADADISRPLELRRQSSSVRMPEEDSITARQTSLRLIRTESPDGGDSTPGGRALRRSSSEDISRGGVTLFTRGLSVDSATVRRPVRGESLDSSLRPGMRRGRSFDRPKMLSPASIPTRGSGVEEFAPVFREKLKDEAIAEGCPVLLSCLPAGSPQPTVQWFKNNELIIESERIKLSSADDGKHTLHVPQVQLARDVGVFTCTASNKLGTVSTSCRLHAARPPGKPNPAEVMQVTSDAAVVAWEPPITGARDTLLSYILQYRKEGEPLWVTVGETLWVTVGTDVCEEVLLVEGLEPGKSYRFRVACGNRAGYGPFSKSSKRVQTAQEGAPIKVRKVDKRVGLRRSHTIVELQPATDRVMLKDSIPQKQYNFEEDVARGRYAVVKKCVDIITSKEYASKVVPITPVNRLEKLREYEALSKLKHSKVLELHDAFITSKYLILVCEKYYGGDVLRYLTTKPHYSEEEVAQFITQVLEVRRGVREGEEEVAQFITQVLEALHYLHTQKIVHLDVKPDNLLLESRRRLDVRLTDFGCARTFPSKTLGELQSTPEFVVNLPQQDSGRAAEYTGVCGKTLGELQSTPEFVAPEVVNYETAGPAADIWSVGVIAFLCLSAQSPFLGVGDHQTIMKVSKGRYDISRVFNSATPYCRQFVQDCLVLSPSDRRPSAFYLLNHDWLINTPERRKHRQAAVFPSAPLKAYAEDYRQRRAALSTKEKIEIRPYKHRPETLRRLHHR